jgi:hypothetical protein
MELLPDAAILMGCLWHLGSGLSAQKCCLLALWVRSHNNRRGNVSLSGPALSHFQF